MWYKVSESQLPVHVCVEIKRKNGSTEFGVFTPDIKFVTDSQITLEINPEWLWRILLNN